MSVAGPTMDRPFISKIKIDVCHDYRGQSPVWTNSRDAVSVSSLAITNSRRRVLLNIAPTSFPAGRVLAKREVGDDTPVEYVQVSLIQPAHWCIANVLRFKGS